MSRLFAGSPLEQPATCEHCKKPIGLCTCPRHQATGKIILPADQPIRIRREKRSGKVVTVVDGFLPRSARTDDLPALLKELKAKFATGGSATSTTIELQGDHQARLVELMKSRGYPAKPSGG